MNDTYKNIKNERIKRHMSQQRLAELSGYADKTMISRIEAGKVDISISTLEAIAKAMNMEAVDLMAYPFDLEDAKPKSDEEQLVELFDGMNEEGKEKLMEQAEFLAGKYKKHNKSDLVQEA